MALAAQDVQNASGAYNKKCARLWPYLIQFNVATLRLLQAPDERRVLRQPSLRDLRNLRKVNFYKGVTGKLGP